MAKILSSHFPCHFRKKVAIETDYTWKTHNLYHFSLFSVEIYHEARMAETFC